MDLDKMLCVLAELAVERRNQHRKWGQQDCPDISKRISRMKDSADRLTEMWNTYELPPAPEARHTCESDMDSGDKNWLAILVEEVAEMAEEAVHGNTSELRKELLQVAAVAVAWVEAIDRRSA